VTSSVTWPLEPQLVVSYWSSVDTMSLSRTVAEILSVKNNWVTSLTLGVTWRHWSRDDWNHRWSFPIGGLLTPSQYLTRLPRYWASNISGSRPWPFRSRDVIGHVTIATTVGRFLFVIRWHHVPISHRCRDIKRHNLDNHIPIVSTHWLPILGIFFGGGRDRRLCHFSVTYP